MFVAGEQDEPPPELPKTQGKERRHSSLPGGIDGGAGAITGGGRPIDRAVAPSASAIGGAGTGGTATSALAGGDPAISGPAGSSNGSGDGGGGGSVGTDDDEDEVEGDEVYVPEPEKWARYRFFAIDVEKGTLIWSTPTPDLVRSGMTVRNHELYYGAADGGVYAINLLPPPTSKDWPLGGRMWKCATDDEV